MIWELIKSDFRKAALPYAIVSGALAAYVLFRPRPLEGTDLTAGMLGVAEGIVLGWCLFRDGGGTEAFLFSRPFTRRRLFWNRFAMGIVLQGLTAGILFTLMATGLRSYIQHFESPYYPMIKWYELSVIKPVGVCGLLGFTFQVFFTLRGRILKVSAGRRKVVAGLSVVFPAALAWSVFGLGLFMRMNASSWAHVAACYFIAILILTIYASLHCLRNMEIEG